MALEPNSNYEIMGAFGVNATGLLGIKFGINLSNTSGCTIEAQLAATLTLSVGVNLRINAFNSASPTLLTIAGDGSVYVRGILSTGSNQVTLSVQLAKVTSGSATAYINSYLRAQKIP